MQTPKFPVRGKTRTKDARKASGKRRDWTAPNRSATATPDRVPRGRAADGRFRRLPPRARMIARELAVSSSGRNVVPAPALSSASCDATPPLPMSHVLGTEAPAAGTHPTETTAPGCAAGAARITRLPPRYGVKRLLARSHDGTPAAPTSNTLSAPEAPVAGTRRTEPRLPTVAFGLAAGKSSLLRLPLSRRLLRALARSARGRMMGASSVCRTLRLQRLSPRDRAMARGAFRHKTRSLTTGKRP